jgi:hypothetical protein
MRMLARFSTPAPIAAALLRLARGLKCRPGGRDRWRFDRIADGTYDPTSQLVTMGRQAIDAGQTLENVEATLVAIRADWRAHFARKHNRAEGVLTVADHERAMREQGEANAALVPVLMHANASSAEIERAMDELHDEISADTQLYDALAVRRQRMAGTGR